MIKASARIAMRPEVMWDVLQDTVNPCWPLSSATLIVDGNVNSNQPRRNNSVGACWSLSFKAGDVFSECITENNPEQMFYTTEMSKSGWPFSYTCNISVESS